MTPIFSLTTSQIVELDPGTLHFDLPPDLVTRVVIEKSQELASAARAIFKASPETDEVSPEGQAPDQDGTIYVPFFSEKICGSGQKPVDIAFNSGKIHNVHFNCDNIQNISFNGGNVRSIAFGLPRYSDIEEDDIPAPAGPQSDHLPLPHSHYLTIQVPPNQKSIDHLRLQGVLQAPEDLFIGKFYVITLNGRSDLGDIRAGRVSLRIDGGTTEAGQMRCDDFKAVVQAGS
jgi:hypothetical protein